MSALFPRRVPTSFSRTSGRLVLPERLLDRREEYAQIKGFLKIGELANPRFTNGGSGCHQEGWNLLPALARVKLVIHDKTCHPLCWLLGTPVQENEQNVWDEMSRLAEAGEARV